MIIRTDITPQRTAPEGSPPHPSNGPDKPDQRVHPLTQTRGEQRKRYSRQDFLADKAKREADQEVKDALKEKFNESEKILNLLRTQGASALQETSEEEINIWAQRASQS